MSTIYLRVKIKDLATEASNIHLEEHRRKARNRRIFLKTGRNPNDCQCYADETGKIVPNYDDVFWGLRRHRVHDVRRESRAAQLAYGFLRGRPYHKLERPVRSPLDDQMLGRVAQLIIKFGDRKEPGFKESVYGELKTWLEAPAPAEVAKAA